MNNLCKYKLLSPDATEVGGDLIAEKNSEDGLHRLQALLAEMASYGECRRFGGSWMFRRSGRPINGG